MVMSFARNPEKFLFRGFDTLGESHQVGVENALDIIALGFDPAKTKIFFDSDLIRWMYPLVLQVARRITFSTVKAVFFLSLVPILGIYLARGRRIVAARAAPLRVGVDAVLASVALLSLVLYRYTG